MGVATSWVLGAVSGAVWGVLLASWILPLSVPARFVATAAIVAALAIAGRVGQAAAGGFALAAGAVASVILAASGVVLGDAPHGPLATVVVGAALTASAVSSRTIRRSPPPTGSS